MPADVDTAVTPHAAALNRPQRRGKVAVEIYKPPPARLHRQQQQLTQSQPQEQQRHNYCRPQPRYNNNGNQQHSNHHNNTIANNRNVTNIHNHLQHQQQPQQPVQQQQQQQQSAQPFQQQQAYNPQQTPAVSVQKPQQHNHSQQKHINIHTKSPRSNRRRGANRTTQHNDRSSCPPEIVPNNPQTTSRPSHQHDDNGNKQSNSNISNTDIIATPVINNTGQLECGASNINRLQNLDHNVSSSGGQEEAAVPSTATTAPSQQLSEKTVTHNDNVSANSNSPACDLRDYLNIKRLSEGQEIKNLSNTVDMLANKYFNKTASPYRGYNNNSIANDSGNNRQSQSYYLNDHLNKLSLNEDESVNLFGTSRSVGNGQMQSMDSCDARRARPDQVLYVPRGRRQPCARGSQYTSDMNHYNNSRSSPLTEQYQNCRPPSPAFSITSIVSEFSGRNRYDATNYAQSISRPSSRMSIYDDEEDKVSGKPPHYYDPRNNSSRESTPGYGKPDPSFNRQTLQLIERCINQDAGRPSSKNSGVYEPGDENNQENCNSLPTKVPGQYYDDPSFGRVSKSPTPNRDSIHSKENVMYPVDATPRRRRSRKNRKRRSQSRDTSIDSIHKDTGSMSNLSRGGGGDRGGSCTFYNSNITSRFDGGSVSLSGSRAGSRNSSVERNMMEDWRQKASSHPTTPVKAIPYEHNSPIKAPSNSSPDGLSNTNITDTPPANSLIHRRNSADKPPTGRPGSSSGDGRRDSFSKVSSPTSPTKENCFSPAQSPREFHNPELQNSITATPADVTQATSQLPSTNKQESTEEMSTINNIVENRVPPMHTEENMYNNSFCQEAEPVLQSAATSDMPLEKGCSDDDTVAKDTAFEELCSEYMCMDWAEEIEKEERLQSQHTGSNDCEERRVDYCSTSKNCFNNSSCSSNSSSRAVKQESCSPSKKLLCNGVIENNAMRQNKVYSSPVDHYVDNNTRKAVCATVSRETAIERTRQDYTRYQSSPPKRQQLYTPPNVRHSPPRAMERCSPPHVRNSAVGRSSPPSYTSVSNFSSGCNSPSSGEQSDGAGGSITPPSGLAHVLELYDFPTNFRNQDLLAVYQGYQAAAPLDIKWVDDTHALVVFSNATIATEALSLQHPLIKSRMLADASPASKSKAARIDEALLPARPRPQTSMVLARRLLSGALGVRVNLTREEREKEARAIRDAKNQKRLVAKQKEDVWEGNV